MDAAIYHLLNKFPWFYQDEIVEFLAEVFDIDVSRGTVCNALTRIKFTRKRLRIEAAQRNQELRTAWQDTLQYYDADQLVFIDETGSDERTGDRSYGWAELGQRATVTRWFGRRDRISALPAYTIDGYIAAKTFSGTCNGEIFRDFIIDDLLPLCNPYPHPRSVIVMDNASVHYTFRAEIEEACTETGVILKFLPPYSPDFNPIEESFSVLKAFIRRHYRREIGQFKDYQSFLGWCLQEVGMKGGAAKKARAHFHHAGIRRFPLI
jgi:transposase